MGKGPNAINKKHKDSWRSAKIKRTKVNASANRLPKHLVQRSNDGVLAAAEEHGLPLKPAKLGKNQRLVRATLSSKKKVRLLKRDAKLDHQRKVSLGLADAEMKEEVEAAPKWALAKRVKPPKEAIAEALITRLTQFGIVPVMSEAGTILGQPPHL